MWSINLRVGAAEFITLASLFVVAALMAVAYFENPIVLVPGVTYGLASSGVYLLYRRYARDVGRIAESVAAARFRVVDTHGVCPYGRQKGDLVAVGPGDRMSPQLCPEAAQVLQLAVQGRDGQPVEQWCCPVYDHLLVFQRERIAA